MSNQALSVTRFEIGRGKCATFGEHLDTNYMLVKIPNSLSIMNSFPVATVYF